MGVLGIDFGSCTSERSADYILSLPGSAPEYMNEVSFGVAPGVVPPLSVSYPSLHFKVCCRGVAVWNTCSLWLSKIRANDFEVNRRTCVKSPTAFDRIRVISSGDLIDSVSIGRRGMSKNFPKQVFCKSDFLARALLYYFALSFFLFQVCRSCNAASECDSCGAICFIFPKFIYVPLTSGHYMAYD